MSQLLYIYVTGYFLFFICSIIFSLTTLGLNDDDDQPLVLALSIALSFLWFALVPMIALIFVCWCLMALVLGIKSKLLKMRHNFLNKKSKKMRVIQATPRSAGNYTCRIVLENFRSQMPEGLNDLNYHEFHSRLTDHFIDSLKLYGINGPYKGCINFSYFTPTRLDSLISHVYAECYLGLYRVDPTYFRNEVHRQLSILRKEAI